MVFAVTAGDMRTIAVARSVPTAELHDGRENARLFEESGPPRTFLGAECDALDTVRISLREVGQETQIRSETTHFERVAAADARRCSRDGAGERSIAQIGLRSMSNVHR